jgi:hypothetical protein
MGAESEKEGLGDQITGQGGEGRRAAGHVPVSWRSARRGIRAARRRPARRDSRAWETTRAAAMMAEDGSATRPRWDFAVRLSWAPRRGSSVVCAWGGGSPGGLLALGEGSGWVHGDALARQRHV